MKTWASCGLAFVVALSVAGVVQAQPPGGRGGFGGGFGGGRGGFGGGGEAFLLSTPEVQKELSITDDQKGLIDEMLADLRQGGGQRPDFGSFRDLSEEERAKRFEEMRKQAEERTKQAEDALKAILNEQQFARYSQLRLQRQGVMALSRPEVADQLGLTQEQKDKLAAQREAERGERGGPGGRQRGEGGPGQAGGERPDFQAMMAEMQKRREKQEADALAVLTPEQKTKWESLQGAKFTFPQPTFGGGRGGPGRPPGGQRPAAE